MDPGGTSSRAPSAETPIYRADWYPDPTRRFEFRYFNGRDWTGDVAVDGNRFIDSLSQTTLPQFASTSGRSAKATASMVLGIGSVVAGWVPFFFVFAAAAAILALVFGIPALVRARREQPVQTKSRAFALTGVILAPLGLAMCGVGLWLTVVTFREVDRFTNIGSYSVEETACVVTDGVATFSGTITNLTNETRSYHITLLFLHPTTDDTLYRSSVDIDDVLNGDTAPWSVNKVVSEDDLDCAVDTVSGPLPFGQS